MQKLWVFMLAWIFLWAALGCRPSEKGTVEKLPPLPQKSKGTMTPTAGPPFSLAAPALTSPSDTPYNPIGKPDPFQPSTLATVEKGKGPKSLLPLEQFEVNDFELVGVVSGSGIKKAIVQDLTGKGYFIQVGTRIGKNGGQVVRITDQEVVVEEPYQDFLGRKTSRTVKLRAPASTPTAR